MLWRPDAGSRGDIRLSLTPAKQRSRSNTEVADDLRKRLAGKVPGMTVRVRAPQGQFILNRILGGESGLEVEIRGYDLNTLETLAARAAEAMRDVPGITDVRPSRTVGVPQHNIQIDRHKAADLPWHTEALAFLMTGKRDSYYAGPADLGEECISPAFS